MNYSAAYDRLIERARDRTLIGYSERHHIVPRCLGGGDHESNIAVLTAEEHYLAHQFLVRLYPDHLGILSAAHVMTTNRIPGRSGNKLYGWLRRRMAIAQTGLKRPPEVGQKISARLKGRKRSPESIAKGSAKARGRVNSPEHRAKLSSAQKGRKHTPEQNARNSATHRGKKQSPETIAKRIASCQARYAITPKPRHTEEAKAKMRASRLAYIAKHGPTFGPEVEARRTLAMKGVPTPPAIIARCVATRMANKTARFLAAEIAINQYPEGKPVRAT